MTRKNQRFDDIMGKVGVVLIIGALAAWTIFLIVALALKVADAQELYHYKVHGENNSTGLVVAGWMWEHEVKGDVRAKIMDQMSVLQECNGSWVGKGVARVGCENGQQYYLEVVE